MNNLINSILVKHPSANLQVLNELNELVESYQLTWITDPEKGGASFIVSDLSKAKGLDTKDFPNNYADYYDSTSYIQRNSSDSTSSIQHYSSKLSEPPFAGKFKRATGTILQKTKELWLTQRDRNLGKINRLWICDWEGAYAYLVQGHSKVAKEFQALGARSIERAVTGAIEEIKTAPVISAPEQLDPSYSEEQQSMDLQYWSSFGPYTLKSERAFLDFPLSNSKTRRLDLVHIHPHKSLRKVVEVWEVKRRRVDYYDVVNTVEAKRYLQLLREYFETDAVTLIVVAPLGGTEEAIAKAESYTSESVVIWSTKQAAEFLLNKAKLYHPDDPWFITKILPKENYVIKRLLKSYV